MTYSAWAFEDAAHIPAATITPQLLHQSRQPDEQQHQPQQQHQQQQQQHQRPAETRSVAAASASTLGHSISPYRPQPPNHHIPYQPHRPCAAVALGVNRTTGRLQWFPSCRYVKIMLLLPAALAPVVLVLLLLGSRLEMARGGASARRFQPLAEGTNHLAAEAANVDAAPEYDSGEGLEDAERSVKTGLGRCTAIRYSLSETLDSEERDVLRDVRTSFIPPEYVYVSPDCVEPTPADEERDEPDAGDGGDDADVDYAERSMTLADLVGRMLGYRVANGENRQRRDAIAHNETTVAVDKWELLKNTVDKLSAAQPVEPQLTTTFVEGSAEQIRSNQAEVMLKYMDATIDPCTDFYKYACGNWEHLNVIPQDKGAYDTFEMLREKLDHILRDLLSEPITRDAADDPEDAEDKLTVVEPPIADGNSVKLLPRLRRAVWRERLRRKRENEPAGDSAAVELNAEDKAKLLYQTCMEDDTINERGVQPLLDFLHTLGGWPALDDSWDSEHFDWLNLTATLRQYNNDILLMLWVGADIKNSNENVIQFDQTSLGLPTRDYFLEPSNAKYLDAYAQFIRTTIECLGASAERAAAEAASIVGFETELARITTAPEARMNVSLLYNKLQLAELHRQIPQIDWLHYLGTVQGRTVLDTESVVMFAMDYMKSLVKLLDRTDRRTVANYLMWRFVRHRINNLDDRFQAAKQQFFFVLFGREKSPERWKMCVSHVNTNMGMAVGAMFVRRYFDEGSKEDTLEMTHELQTAFREILNTTEWLDAPTRHFAELKVNAMQLRIGYPDFILRRDELNAKFAPLDIEAGRYFENTLRVLRHIASVEYGKLGEAINRTEWNTAPAIINAYYSRNKNQILFPAGILQPPFYHRHFPRALNFGGIGVVIGHELTHGFDDKGRLFDMDGNMLRWWSDSAVVGFHRRAQCLVSQYGNYTVPDVPGLLVNGESTQGENIADNGGLKQSYRAYSGWLAAQPDAAAAEQAERMPGMERWSSRQLFFLNFAQIWCGAMRPEAALNKLKTAVHSPGMYRVIGTLRNSEEFAQVWGCAAGTPMNPVDKCRVW